MKKEERIQIRTDSETKAKLKEVSEAEGRTISNYVLMLIKKDLQMKNK